MTVMTLFVIRSKMVSILLHKCTYIHVIIFVFLDIHYNVVLCRF